MKVHLQRVGWLTRSMASELGRRDEEACSKLRTYLPYRFERKRGLHFCPFCPPPCPDELADDSIPGLIDPPENQFEEGVLLGSAELRVVGTSGVFAAPDLLIHYVCRHEYALPEEFRRELLAGPEPGSAGYWLALEAHVHPEDIRRIQMELG